MHDRGVSDSIEISWLRYHVKTRARRGSSFQSLFFLEESCRVQRSDTQTFSNFSTTSKEFSGFQNVLPASPNKTSSAQTHKYPHNIKFLGHGSNNIQKHHKPQKQTKIHLFHAQTGSIWFQIGSYLVPIGSYGFYSSEISSYKLKMVS